MEYKKKNIITKDFKGGEATCVFGGMELNLMQADINGEVILEINAVFGGIQLIIPSHWRVNYQETVSVLGGIEDKRPRNTVPDTNKTIILKGHAVFGGIEINSY